MVWRHDKMGEVFVLLEHLSFAVRAIFYSRQYKVLGLYFISFEDMLFLADV